MIYIKVLLVCVFEAREQQQIYLDLMIRWNEWQLQPTSKRKIWWHFIFIRRLFSILKRLMSCWLLYTAFHAKLSVYYFQLSRNEGRRVHKSYKSSDLSLLLYLA